MFLRELGLSLKGFVQSLSPDEHVLLVPQNISIEQLIISREFAESHVVRINPLAPYQMVSLTGRRLMLSEDRHLLYMLAGQGEGGSFDASAKDLSVFWDRESSFFDAERKAIARSPSRAETYVVLREGSVDLARQPLPVFLLSHPLSITPVGQGGSKNSYSKGGGIPMPEWAPHPASLVPPDLVLDANDPFMISSPLSSSPREVTAESEDDMVDRIQVAFSSNNPPPAMTKSQSQPSLDWIFEMGAVGAKSSSNNIAAPAPRATSAVSTSMSQDPKQLEKARERQKRMEQEKLEREKRERYKAAFFEKMKNRKASDLVQGIKAFVAQFSEKPPVDPTRRAEVVRNFLQVSEDRIRKHPVWQGASEDELDEMAESLERFVVSKIYRSVFAPSTADIEQDEKLKQRIQELSWIEPRHLDIPLDVNSRRSTKILNLAIEQLRGWNTFKAPRDKMVCILNACKAVWKLLDAKSGGKAAGADDFLPHLIFTVIRANPPNLHSNVDYISRYRHPEKMQQEFGYYFTQLASVVSFLEHITFKSLSVSEEEFVRNCAAASSKHPSIVAPIPVMSALPTTLTRSQSAFSVLEPTPPSSTPPLYTPASTSITQKVERKASFPGKEVFRFVGRDVNTLTLAEVKDLLVSYEALARYAESTKTTNNE